MLRLPETMWRYERYLIILAFTVNASGGSWISIAESTEHFYWARSLCPTSCSDGLVTVKPTTGCLSPLCFHCDCDESCVVKGTCCPTEDGGMNKKYLLTESHSSDPSSDHFYNRLQCITHPMVMNAFLAAARCPQNWTDEAVKKQCENPKGDSLASIIPYFDRKIKIAYTNMFCLLCNGHDPDSKETVPVAQSDEFDDPTLVDEPRFQAWPLNLDCKHYQNLFHITNIYSMYLAALKHVECEVRLKVPNGVKKCPPGMELQLEPENCTSEYVRSLCYNVPPFPAFSVSGYKNVYCYLCAEPETSQFPRRACDPTMEQFSRYPPIYMPFNASQQLHSSQDQPTIGCLSGYWANDTDQCVPFNCSAGKERQPDESCSTVLNSIRGLRYDLHMVLTPDNIIHMGSREEESIESMLTTLKDSLARLEAKIDLSVSITRQSCFQNSTYHVESILIVGNIQGPRSMSRDEFEENLVELVTTSSWNLTIIDSEGKSRTLTMSLGCLGKDQCEAFKTKFVGGENVTECIKDVKNGALGEKLAYFPNLIEVRPDLICPIVALAPSKDPEVINGKFTPTVHIGNKEIRFMGISRFSFVDNKLLVCLDLLKKVSIHQEKEAGSSASLSTDKIIFLLSFFICYLSYFSV